jgi:hypothetical protein
LRRFDFRVDCLGDDFGGEFRCGGGDHGLEVVSLRAKNSTKAGLVASFSLYFSRKEFLRISCFVLDKLQENNLQILNLQIDNLQIDKL